MPTKVKIDFLVPGFSKCGTTTLCNLLDKHPGIYIPALKEPWYFSARDFEHQHEHYDQHFAPAGPDQLKGEGSVSYSGAGSEDISVERIHENNPECRFIFIARDPRRRIESSYREMHHSGVNFGFNAPYELGACLAELPQITQDSLYWRRISTYRQRFGDEAILVVLLEELQSDPVTVLQACFRHLGVDESCAEAIPVERLNAGRAKLYDTRFLRYLRTNPKTGFTLARLSPGMQDRILRPMGLRRPFGGDPVSWDQASREILEKKIYPDTRKFLEYCGRPPSVWGLNKEEQQ